MLVLAAAAAGSAKAVEIDGELLATCASIHRFFAEDERHSAIMEAANRADHDRLWAEVDQAVWQPLNAAVDRLSEFRARTPEGIAAKARVTEFLLMRYHGTEIAEGCEGEEVRLALSLARDITGRASA
jgi:hypothetical protein